MLKFIRMAMLIALVALVGAAGCADPDDAGSDGWDFGDNNTPDGLQPSISTPERVVWPNLVPPAQEWPGDWKVVEVQNTGDAPLEIQDIKIQGSTRFAVSFPNALAQERVEEDTDTWVESIKPGGVMPVRVWFTPVDTLAQFATLVFDSNDPESPSHSLALIGNEDARCLAVQPAQQLDFGYGWIGLESSLEVVLENCGLAAPLNLADVRLGSGTDDVFTLVVDEGSIERVLQPGEKLRAQVDFRPEEERAYQGELVVESDDAMRPELRVPIRGQGTRLVCPTPRGTAQVREGAQGEGGSTIEARLMGFVKFDASPSLGPEREITRYEWTLLSSPPGSRSLLENADTPESGLFLDSIGVYKVALKVYDELEAAECDESAVFTIHAVSGADITVHLAWEAAAAPVESGVDMDLHYRHPNATQWRELPWDCYYANRNTTWGADMVIDSIFGDIPEVLRHSDPEDLTYRIGVNYYSDHENGPGLATVRVYIHDVEVFAVVEKRLTMGQFWEVATVDGGALTVTAVDEVSERAN